MHKSFSSISELIDIHGKPGTVAPGHVLLDQKGDRPDHLK
jgi:hypothetical protein